ncbi:MAG TPA: hypothetical protein VIG33_15325 [Pseudobdellovibrionaceae bacterium]
MKSIFMGIILLFSSLFNSLALAQDLNFQEYRKFLMSGTQSVGTKMAIQTTCTTSTGQTYRVGEKGYDTCLNTVKDQFNKKHLASEKSSTAPEATAGASTTIHFGN